MMITPHDHSMRTGFILSCVLVGLLISGMITPASAQVVLPLLEPTPSSTLTSSTVKFVGGLGGQPGEQHWLSVGIRNWDFSIFHQSLGTGNTATVSGLIPTGTLFVRYFTYTHSAGWQSELYTYQMNVQSGEPRVWNCGGADTDCLINAITIGNGSGNPEVIRLAGDVYTFDSVDTNNNFLPSISGDITIQGAGADNPTSFRTDIRSERSEHTTFFSVLEFGTLNLSGVFIEKNGFGIKNDGTVMLEDVTISGTRLSRDTLAPHDEVGIVNNQTGTMTIKDSTVARNGAVLSFPRTRGGGIANHGTMEISGSTIKGNRATDQGNFAGIYNDGRMTIKDSTIANNLGGKAAAGIGNLSGGELEISSCIILNNQAEFVGGIENRGEMAIHKSVIVGNKGDDIFFGTGGIDNGGHLTISQTVIAGNTAITIPPGAGGIRNSGDLIMNQSVVMGNEAGKEGAGIFNDSGQITLTETVITNNRPVDCIGCP